MADRSLRYRIAKAAKYAQRMVTWVAAGFVLILGSHWWADEGEREFMRDSGAAIAGVAAARWLAQQGRRQVDAQGRQTRTPTLRISAEEQEGYMRLLRRKRGGK